MSEVYFFVKLPRAGGSTLARKWERFETDYREYLSRPGITLCDKNECIRDNPRVIINDDTIMNVISGHRYSSYAKGFTHEVKFIMLKYFMKLGYDIIIDDTHTSYRSLEQILSVAPQARPIVINTSVEECIRRARATNQPDLERPINRMEDNLRNLYSHWAVWYGDWMFPYDYKEHFNQQNWDRIVNSIRDNIKPEKHFISD
jgi:hypothetical protein